MSAADMAVTGAIMGVVHVLAGPEHLSAMATLAGMDVSETDGGARRRCESFSLGIRWGVGHGLGLAAASFVLISAESVGSEWIAVDYAWAMTMESLTGMFMILLGAYGMHKAKTNRMRHFSFAAPSKAEGTGGVAPRRRRGGGGGGVVPVEEDAGGIGPVAEDVESRSDVLPTPHRYVPPPLPSRRDKCAGSITRVMAEVLEEMALDDDSDSEGEGTADEAAGRPSSLEAPSRPDRASKLSISKSFVDYQRNRPAVMRATALVGSHVGDVQAGGGGGGG